MLNLCHKGLGAGERRQACADPLDVDYLIAWYDLPSKVVSAGILELKLAGKLTHLYGNRVSRQLNYLMDLVDTSSAIASNQPTIQSG